MSRHVILGKYHVLYKPERFVRNYNTNSYVIGNAGTRGVKLWHYHCTLIPRGDLITPTELAGEWVKAARDLH